ncbi:MAG TPA: hypothetical protein VGA10_04090, partial [Thermoanaerobaculia bacterium]
MRRVLGWRCDALHSRAVPFLATITGRGEQMPEEFGTVNLKAGTQQREIELLRRHYRSHREALSKMISDAPSEHLAGEYQKLVADIEMAVRKLDELEGKTAPPPSLADTNPSIKVTPGNRPLMRTPDST